MTGVAVCLISDGNIGARQAPPVHRPYAKDLLRAMIPFKRWWLTQASLDIVYPQGIGLERRSHSRLAAYICIGPYQ